MEKMTGILDWMQGKTGCVKHRDIIGKMEASYGINHYIVSFEVCDGSSCRAFGSSMIASFKKAFNKVLKHEKYTKSMIDSLYVNTNYEKQKISQWVDEAVLKLKNAVEG